VSNRPELGSFPAGGAGLTVEAYLEFLRKEYLGDFIRAGGAAVRFVVLGDDDVARRWHAGLAAVAAADSYTYVLVDAESTRVHLMHELFFAISRQIDWQRLSAAAVRTAYDGVGLPAPAGADVSVGTVARHHEVDARELNRSVRRRLEQTVLADSTLAPEFRLAMLRLCHGELGSGEVDAGERAAVLAWLRGEPVPLARLKPALLYTRIGRHNARPLLLSLAGWLVRNAGSGLVLDLDLDRLAVAHRPPLAAREGVYYSKAATVDAYEVLRQLVDATDTLHSALVAVGLPPALVTDEGRGLPSYTALHLRIVDEVRDRRRANPFAALVRLEVRLEAVP